MTAILMEKDVKTGQDLTALVIQIRAELFHRQYKKPLHIQITEERAEVTTSRLRADVNHAL